MKNPIDRILKLTNQTDTCWLFQGTKISGYGQVHYKGKTELAHRVMYELFKEAPPKHLDVCHKCDIRNCINPDHLFLGTRKDNMQDAVKKGRVARQRNNWQKQKTHCPAGHEYTKENTYIQTGKQEGHRKCKICTLNHQKLKRQSKLGLKL